PGCRVPAPFSVRVPRGVSPLPAPGNVPLDGRRGGAGGDARGYVARHHPTRGGRRPARSVPPARRSALPAPAGGSSGACGTPADRGGGSREPRRRRPAGHVVLDGRRGDADDRPGGRATRRRGDPVAGVGVCRGTAGLRRRPRSAARPAAPPFDVPPPPR